MELMDFRSEIWDSLRTMMEYLERTFRGVCQEDGMTRLQFRVLLELGKKPLTVGSVGKRFGMAHGNVSAMCKKLEKAGYLHRVRSTQDERQVLLELTEQGQGVLSRTVDALEERYAPVWQVLEQEKLRQILDGLIELNGLLQQMAEIRESEESAAR